MISPSVSLPLGRLASGLALAVCAVLALPEARAQTPPAVASPARAPAPSGVPAELPVVKAAPGEAAAAPARPRPGRVMDKVELEASQITGNRELPRVLYIVPWRQPGTGEVDGQPINSLLYELTRPVDREVLRREARYHEGLRGGDGLRDTSQAQP
jgi:hypothetical protein